MNVLAVQRMWVDKYIHDIMRTILYLNSMWLIFGHCLKNFSAHIHRFKRKVYKMVREIQKISMTVLGK